MKEHFREFWLRKAAVLGLYAFFVFPAFAAGSADLVPFGDITSAQAAALIVEKGADPLFVILDVRTTEEFSESRIKGSLNIDIKAADFKENIEKLDREGIYLVVCRGGVRSARAVAILKDMGFQTAYNLGGGLMRWQEEKLPLETEAAQDSLR